MLCNFLLLSIHRYGETNLHHTNYRLSDIKDYKAKSLDRIPIYPNDVSPSESVNGGIPVNVPIFTEKLDGRYTFLFHLCSRACHLIFSNTHIQKKCPQSVQLEW